MRSIAALAALEPRVLAARHRRPLAEGAAALHALAARHAEAAGERNILIPLGGAGAGRYRPPPRWYVRLQRLGLALTRLGLSPRYVVTLEVPGRRSGVIRRTSLVQVEHDGERYLVSLTGEAQWVRNVRSAEGPVVLGRGGRRRTATLVEVPVADRPPVIRAYLLRQGRRAGSTPVAREARYSFGLSADPSLEEIRSVADRYPVFRVLPR